MRKRPLPKVVEPEEGVVHYGPDPVSTGMTLCGRTDWIGTKGGRDTNEPVNCPACISIKQFCDRHAS